MSKHYEGLTTAQVEQSRREHGINVLSPAQRTPLWLQFLEKFRDPLIVILMVAGCLSVGISCYEYFYLGMGLRVFFEPVGIFAAILLATGLSFIFETKAGREFDLLNRVSDDEPIHVFRDGRPTKVPRRDLVVGDVVVLSTGQEVPADGELLEAVTMTVDESSLTGEPLCHKCTEPEQFDSEATYPTNHVLRGTKVMEGHGVMRVLRVGDATENGRVMTEAQMEDGVKTPLSLQLDKLGRVVTFGSYGVGVLIMVGRVVLWFAAPEAEGAAAFVTYLLQSIMIAVTLVVCSVPEGLPMAVTLSLAYSMRRMLKTGNLVRRMHACETMGATTVICTDKTGTLTQNQMRVNEVLLVDQEEPRTAALIREGMAVNSTAVLDAEGQPIGNPTEGALLLWLKGECEDYQALRDASARLAELPFNTERKLMATMVRSAATGGTVLHIKGAPEIIAALCGVEVPEVLPQWQAKAMRTLALACKECGAADNVEELLNEGGFTMLGYVAISDPLRADVPGAVAECIKAGIEIKIVTGDTPGTAVEIARQIGVSGGVITGPEFAAMTDEELTERVAGLSVIARARPTDKRRLVEALQRRGEVVAVTGDGTNDAPALNAAHVGLSMGDGTAVAREASDITITDNSFVSISRAVMWGRSLYRNIQRFIMFQMTVNVAACLVVMGGAFMDTHSPLTVTQMLWVNLIMDTFAAMALASLPPTQSVMRETPRRQDHFIIGRHMTYNIIGIGALFAVVMLGLLYRMQHVVSTDLFNVFTAPATVHGHITSHEQSLFFTIFIMMQAWNLFNARAFATRQSAMRLHDCKGFLFIISLIFVGQIAIVQLGGEFFNVEPLSLMEWVVIVLGTSPVLLVGEALRLRIK